jgi:hypothetical protein
VFEIICFGSPCGLPSLLYNGQRLFPPGIKGFGRGVDHKTPSSAKIINVWSILLHLLRVLVAYFSVTLTFILSEERLKSVLLVPDTNFVCFLTKAVYLCAACIWKSPKLTAEDRLPISFEATSEIKKILQQLRHHQLPCFVTCHKLHVHTNIYTHTLFSTQIGCYVTVLIRE